MPNQKITDISIPYVEIQPLGADPQESSGLMTAGGDVFPSDGQTVEIDSSELQKFDDSDYPVLAEYLASQGKPIDTVEGE